MDVYNFTADDRGWAAAVSLNGLFVGSIYGRGRQIDNFEPLTPAAQACFVERREDVVRQVDEIFYRHFVEPVERDTLVFTRGPEVVGGHIRNSRGQAMPLWVAAAVKPRREEMEELIESYREKGWRLMNKNKSLNVI